MRHKLVFPAMLVAAAAALPTVVVAQKPDQELSIDAAPNVVKFGNDLVVTGRLTGGTAQDISGQKVTLRRDEFPYEGQFDRVGTADTDAAGNYEFTLKPVANAKYRAFGKGGTESAEVIVPVRVAVTLEVANTSPERGKRVKFSGMVAPPHDGKRAKIQRRKKGGWRTVKRATLEDSGDVVSSYSTRVRIRRSGRYRVRFAPRDGDHVAGRSKAVRVTVD